MLSLADHIRRRKNANRSDNRDRSAAGTCEPLLPAVLAICLVLSTSVALAGTGSSPDRPSLASFWGKHSVGNYIDSRGYHTLALNSEVDLPLSFKLWGFTDIHGNQKDVAGRFAFERYFMEYRLLRELPAEWLFGLGGVGAIVEYNDFDRPGNSLLRTGLYYGTALQLPWGQKGGVQCRVFPIESRKDRWQISLGYGIPITDKLSLTGFADLNFHSDGPDRWVIEPQLNYALSESLSVLLEFRYNGFEDDAPNLDGTGIAAGLQISF
ncbi:MAG: hypothetical protein GWO24_35325 [Akkermansiaceae bacterium]|nr:hypothetical protein [Akkermansiaceae bacterium]